MTSNSSSLLEDQVGQINLNKDDFPSKAFPIKSAVNSIALKDGRDVTVALIHYHDRIQVSLSALDGRPGSFFEVTQTQNQNVSNGIGASNRKVYNVRTLLGESSEHLIIAARQIAERLAVEKPLLISLGFKEALTAEEIDHLAGFVARQTVQ